MLTDHVHTNQVVDTVVASIDVDDRAIVSASHDTTARVWRYGAHPRETSDGGGFAIKVDDAPLVLPHPAWVIAVQLAAGVVATGCCDKAVRTFSTTSGQVLRVLHGHRAWVCSVALSGDVLVSSDASGKFLVGAEALAVLRSISGPIGVAAVCGRARQGKSFVLNAIARTAGGSSGSSGKGFTVAATHKPCTKGLWLWSAPIPRVAADGTRCVGV
jgi:hypothetical protein